MINRWLEQAVQRDPSKVAIVYGAERILYGELLKRVRRCANGLRAYGVREGDCVAVVLGNCPEFIETFFAVASLGAILLPLNPQYRKEELQRFLADAQPRLIVSVGQVLSDMIGLNLKASLICVGPFVNGAIPWSALVGHEALPCKDTHVGRVLYLYTSGSTDSYKRICCTQENLYWEARNFVETAGLCGSDTILCTVPLFHSYGIGNCLLDAAYLGATLVMLPPEPDGEGAEPPFASRCHRMAELLREEKVRFYPGVPYQFSVLASLPGGFPIDLSSVRLLVSSGDAVPANTYARFLARFGKPIRSLYGSTEAGSIAINMNPDSLVEWGSVGTSLHNVTIEIRGADGLTLPPGEDGEIWVQSPTIPPTGYDNRSDLLETVFRDGYYNTGDIGHKDHRGHLMLAGRKQSFINIGGYKVDTSEVEDVLESCPGVREAAVLGVEIPRMGTLVKAAVVTDGPCDEAELRAFCRQRLAFYKVPRLIETFEALPRSAVGKVLKSELGGVDQYLATIRGVDSARLIKQIPTASPGRRRSLIASVVHAQAAAVLARPLSAVPRNVGFTELGMDSFASIELHARLEYLFEVELPQTFAFDHPTINAATEVLIDLTGDAVAATTTRSRP